MRVKQFRISLVVGILSLLGILFIQGFGFYATWNYQEKQLDQNIWMSLKETASTLNTLHNCEQGDLNPVHKIDKKYYLVDVSCEYTVQNLVHAVKTMLNQHNINMEFQLATYQCANDSLEYLGVFPTDESTVVSHSNWIVPDLSSIEKPVYYFCINFSGRDVFLRKQMHLWIILALFSFGIVAFFSYTLFASFKQKHLAELQKDFINNMTHEFKTPISSINIAAKVLRDYTEAPERYQTYAGIVDKENQRLNRQVEHVLRISRLEKGKQLYNLENISAHSTLNELVENRNWNSEVALSVQLNATSHKIRADKLHFSNLIENLIDNGIKYNQAPIKIELKTENRGNKLEIQVIDNGIGIDKKFQKQVFKRFFRVPTGNLHDVKGFGLGLYYVHQVCRALRWTIHLESTPNQGTIVKLQIPTLKPRQ